MTPKWLYAVGDVHGCYDKLMTLIDKIEMHAAGAAFTCVFLGDYVDRGPQSRDVVDLVKRLCTADETRDRHVAVRGNHEQLMIDACNNLDEDEMDDWLSNGGTATLASYKAHEDDLKTHLHWLGALPSFYETEHHFFVHAGVSRRFPLDEQTDEVMLWTRNWERQEFDFGKHIVYGHNPFDEPRLLRHSSGLDTGAVYGGPLSAGVFDPSRPAGPILVLQAE